MTLRANDTWGTVITTPPIYYPTADASALSVSLTKEAIDLAIGAWGNYGPTARSIASLVRETESAEASAVG